MTDEWYQSVATWAGEYAWILLTFGVVLVTLILAAVVRRVLIGIAGRMRQTSNVLDDALFDALVAPTRGLIWIVGISIAAHFVGKRTQSALFDFIEPARNVGIILMFTWFLLRFIRTFEVAHVRSKNERGEPVDETFVRAVGKLVRAAVFVTASLIVLQTLGINITGVVAFGGVGGIAVGFAARDLIANLFGGLTVYLDRPFAVGDWIRSPDQEIEGTVEDIGWRRTIIRTFDKRPLYVPNSVFTTISVENPSRMSHRRIHETIGVRYDDVSALPKILNDVREYLRTSPDIDATQTLMVNFNQFGASSLDFFVYAFTKTVVWTEYHAVKERVLFDIAGIIEKHGAEVAFPTTTVHVPNQVQLEYMQRQAVAT